MEQSSRDSDGAPGDRDFGDAEFFEMSLDHLCVAGFDGYWKRLNPSWTRTLGWTIEELMSRPLIEFCHPDDRAAVLDARSLLFVGLPIAPPRNRYRCKDGSYRWFEWRSVSNVERQLVYAIARDITADKEAERVRQELTESLEATLNSIAEGVISTRADSTVARMNPIAERLTGWTSAEAVGKPLDEIFRLLEEGSHPHLVARDGTKLPIAFSRSPLKTAEGNVSGAVLVFRDMTAEKQAREAQERMQRQLILADRLASLGTLAAGIAHEINNPLAYVLANLELLVGQIESGDADRVQMAREALEGGERIRKIVRSLKTFCRAEEERRSVIEVRPVIEQSINMAMNEIRHRARLVKDYLPIPRVDADESRLVQVFVNLLVNAAQAIPEGNTENNEIRIVTFTNEAGQAVIEIHDTGEGIPETAMPRIFDPFFTTKPIGVGTGLGLSICHGIVSGMDGKLTAESGAGRGTVLRVVLPAAATPNGGP
ncbi:Sensory box histidine kinase/response regulator [Labilithrix luteola]|uniref:histidine kinase n=1 Tax=Labilithrix luteola TaxID=1391654 RepID=A0A0K1PXU3_9BACT|nr:Sensory box histidine kinase/response regulator [Labilithrix luteola]